MNGSYVQAKKPICKCLLVAAVVCVCLCAPTSVSVHIDARFHVVCASVGAGVFIKWPLLEQMLR